MGQLLRSAKFPRDKLPYTAEFDRLKRRFESRFRRDISETDFWRLLARVGKRGGFARSARRRRSPPTPSLSTEQQLELLRLLPDGIGNRDQLPYTEEFDDLHRRFSRLTHTRLDKHEFWRAVCRVGKRSRKPQPLFATAPLGGLPKELVELLEFQNPWWSGNSPKPTARFRRWAFGEIMRRLDSKLTPIIAVRGPRQVGKTTIQEQLIEELLRLKGVNPARIFRIQFDDVPSLGTFNEPVLALIRWFERNVLGDSMNALARRGEPVYLFFDEVQNLPSWAPQLKSLVDHVAGKTLITGSSALRIESGQDSLAGRISMIEMGPLRLHEIAGVRQLGGLPAFQTRISVSEWPQREFWLELLEHSRRHGKILKRAFDAFSDVGGYPICHKDEFERSDLSQQIVSQVVKRTLVHDLKAGSGGKKRNPGVLEETFKRVCRYAGQGVRHQRIREEVEQVLGPGVRDRTVTDAIRFLASSLLIHEIPPLEALTRRQAHPHKICLCDHFVREGMLQERIPLTPRELAGANQAVSTISGHIIESAIGYYLRGIPGLQVSWFPQRESEPEVDFILTIGLQRIPIEVKYCRGGVRSKNLDGIRSFCSQAKYNADFGLVITQEQSGVVAENAIAIPAYALLAVR